MTDTANRVKKIVAEHLGVEESKVTDNASFIDDLGADSLDKFLLLKMLSTIFLRMLSLLRHVDLMKLA